ncbi:hypothetical protein [Salipiger sp.]|uniref:hypothetical protein n=1 Tax=Salipiger sp. TaxID=2078585 RepID=UPI003A97C11D
MESRSEPRPRLLVIGHGRHGKDTAAGILAERLGLSAASSSEFVAERAIWPLVRDRGIWPDWRAAYSDRHAHREMWFHAIRAYNLGPGPGLAEQLLREHAIYVGMRARAELIATRDLFDAVLWVDASARLLGEDPGSMELSAADADLVIDNNGGLSDLTREVAAVAVLVGARWAG